METTNKSNKQFMILSAISIIMVVICHLAENVGITKYIFPYTSFFMPLFVFVSGYFYNTKKEDNILNTIWQKFKKIMLPFFVINLFYGILCNILKNAGIINYGMPINLYTLFVQPFINNSQFIFNFPSWFVPAFFVTYVIYVLIHKYITKLKINNFVLLIPLILINMIAVYYQDIAKLNDLRSLVLRVAFFLSFFQFGYLYKNYLQKYDEKLKTIFYLPILIGINIILKLIFKNLGYDLHEFSGFNTNAVYLPLLTAITGILFWLRISKILVKYIGENKLINYISNNTFSIMSHHLLYAFIVNIVLYLINLECNIPYFDVEAFKISWIYIYKVPGFNLFIQIFYAFIGVSGPLLAKFMLNKIGEAVNKRVFSLQIPKNGV